jgi:hypothetical protein
LLPAAIVFDSSGSNKHWCIKTPFSNKVNSDIVLKIQERLEMWPKFGCKTIVDLFQGKDSQGLLDHA